MRYFFNKTDNYIVAIGFGNDGEEITKGRYDEIAHAISGKPKWENGIDYRLKTDLTWEAYERIMPEEPTAEDDTEATEADYLEALAELGVSE